MINLIKKELYLALASYSIYITAILFLLCNSLFIWVFNSDSNILNNNLASLNSFFNTCPLLLIMLIPSITMNLFHYEIESGNIEILLTKPLSYKLILLSKYISCLITSSIIMIPTVIYISIISYISVNSIDIAEITSSYIGLFFIIAVFNSLSLLVSVFGKSQMTTFFISMFLCWFFYFGINLITENINTQEANLILSFFCIKTHYMSLRNGIIFLSDIIYFLSFCTTLIIITINSLKLYGEN